MTSEPLRCVALRCDYVWAELIGTPCDLDADDELHQPTTDEDVPYHIYCPKPCGGILIETEGGSIGGHMYAAEYTHVEPADHEAEVAP